MKKENAACNKNREDLIERLISVLLSSQWKRQTSEAMKATGEGLENKDEWKLIPC